MNDKPIKRHKSLQALSRGTPSRSFALLKNQNRVVKEDSDRKDYKICRMVFKTHLLQHFEMEEQAKILLADNHSSFKWLQLMFFHPIVSRKQNFAIDDRISHPRVGHVEQHEVFFAVTNTIECKNFFAA